MATNIERPFDEVLANREQSSTTNTLRVEISQKYSAVIDVPFDGQSRLVLDVWPDNVRGIPNAMLRSALFSIAQERGVAKKGELLASVGGIEIRLTGERFNQTDLEVLAVLLHLARTTALASEVAVSANKLLTALGRESGGHDHRQLKEELVRLRDSFVDCTWINQRKTKFSGTFLKYVRLDKKSRTYIVAFSEQLLFFFAEGYTRLNWKERRSLGKNSLAKWLHGFYASHAQPFAYKVATLKAICGSNRNRLGDFRKALKVALDELKRVGAIVDRRGRTSAKPLTDSSREIADAPEDAGPTIGDLIASAVAIPNDDDNANLTCLDQLPFQKWTLDALRALEWKRFELLCARYYEMLGLTAETVYCGPDQGIDIKLSQPGSSTPSAIVQCKAWTTGPVGVASVRELLGVMASEKIEHGVFLTTSTFTNAARLFAASNPLHLVAGIDFVAKLRKLSPVGQNALLEFAFSGDYATPTCASCGIKMVPKQGTKGKFFGCVNYPRCQSSLAIKLRDQTTAVTDAQTRSSLECHPTDFKKANDSIGFRVVEGELSALSQKIFNLFVAVAQREQLPGVHAPDRDPASASHFWIPLNVVIKQIQYHSNDYEYLKAQVLALQSVKVVVESVTTWTSERLVSGVRIYYSKGMKSKGGDVWLGFAFPPEVTHVILKPTTYTCFSLFYQTKLRTASSLALYEICRRYATSPSHLTQRTDWVNWYYRITGSVISDTPLDYKYFKRDHVLKSLAEINAITDIDVELIEHYGGRTVKEIQFKVYLKAISRQRAPSKAPPPMR
jgi:hypothetical protein